jgi:pyruvate,orthophosphate dikinase
LARLEHEFRDVQDVEFTIEDGQLFILQTRDAKRTPQAALRFAVDLVKEGAISPAEGLRRLEGVDLEKLAVRKLADAGEPCCAGTGASGGVAAGRAAFDSASAARLAAGGDPVILVRPDTSTADVAGFAASEGIVTAVGGRTAHAALVARQMGKPCIVGCAKLTLDAAARRAEFAGHGVAEGDWLSIDAGRGTIHLGRAKLVAERPEAELAEVAKWRKAVV